MNKILSEMLEKYEIKTDKDEINALKEIIQELVISGLSKSDFFNRAAFYGGTALRIFYDLDRFSEDLDFALVSPDKNFDLSAYFPFIEKEVSLYGLNLKVDTKIKTKESNISSAFLKGDTMEHILIFFSESNLQNNSKLLRDIKIKFEIDINPPSGAEYEIKYKLLPTPHSVRLYNKESLFAGKIHAILCRNWSHRTKGRDLYDYAFFLSKNIKVNMNLVKSKLIESNVLKEDDNFDINILKNMLNEKFKLIDYDAAKNDVAPFLDDSTKLNIWKVEFFQSITDNLHAEQ
jgi:predicted nucleotidyltransferase component of viral defense system